MRFSFIDLVTVWLLLLFVVLVVWGLFGEDVSEEGGVRYNVLCEVPEGNDIVKREFLLGRGEYLGLYHSRAGVFDFKDLNGVRVISPRCWYKGGEK